MGLHKLCRYVRPVLLPTLPYEDLQTPMASLLALPFLVLHPPCCSWHAGMNGYALQQCLREARKAREQAEAEAAEGRVAGFSRGA